MADALPELESPPEESWWDKVMMESDRVQDRAERELDRERGK